MADEPAIPLIKRVNVTPIQQRIRAVNDDDTLSFALHGDLNRLIQALGNVVNYNADTLKLVIDTLARYGILVKRVEDVEAAQAQAAAEAALTTSYTDPTSVLSVVSDATAATVTVANHKRIYNDAAKTTVDVIGKTFAGLPLDAVLYFYYDDATRAGGAVDIKYSTNNLDAAQTGIRHSLGYIVTPSTAQTDPSDGGGVSPPGGDYGPRRNRIPQVDDQ